MARLATVAAFGFSDFNPSTLLPVYRELGCESVQYYRNPKNPPKLEDVKRIIADAGLVIDSIHGVFGPEHDPSSPDEPLRQFAMRTYREEGEIARKLGGPMVVVHPAPMAADPTLVTDIGRQMRIDPMRRSMEQLARAGESLGVIYLIENIPANYFFGEDAQLIARMVRQFDHPNLKMCFDTGHAHMTTKSLADRDLAACADVVAYFHVNDNDGTLDAHQIPGLGTCPWEGYAKQFAKMPDAVPAMLELFYSEEEMKDQVAEGLGERLKKYLALGAGVKDSTGSR
ncbi:MAG: sugar phosphate isomerase/epimerase family protein [Phycisphaeraceae bacterium]